MTERVYVGMGFSQCLLWDEMSHSFAYSSLSSNWCIKTSKQILSGAWVARPVLGKHGFVLHPLQWDKASPALVQESRGH